MIEIEIRKCADKKLKTLLLDASYYFISSLMPRKRNLEIEILINKKLLKEEGMSASCSPGDLYSHSLPYEFFIEIEDSLSDREKLSVLAHEFAHVRQYSTGRLSYVKSNPNISIWDGAQYKDEDIAYEDMPWEIDAIATEEYLLLEYLNNTSIQI